MNSFSNTQHYTKKETDDKLKSIQTQIDNITNNQIQIKRKHINCTMENLKWIEILDTSDNNFEFYIINAWIQKNENIFHNIASCNTINYINFLYSYRMQTYYIYFNNKQNNNDSTCIIVDYLQVPRKIKIDI